MSRGEFDVIEGYFRGLGSRRTDVVLGIGDDAALLQPPFGCELAATTDTLVAGRHFLAGIPAHCLGQRALAVNLSDIAAMGAAPAWALLSLTLPAIDEDWLAGFAAGFGELAAAYDVALVGGNLSAGPLSITVQLFGFAPQGGALRRSGAQPGDLLYVTGTVGDAAAGLLVEQGELAAGTAQAAQLLRDRYRCPTPRVAAGLRLRALASACIDVSDGLLADIGKLARASACGAQVEVARLPLSGALLEVAGPARAQQLGLGGGDDYELCFTIAPTRVGELATALPAATCAITRIGSMRGEPGVVVTDGMRTAPADLRGYDHFAR